MTIVLLVPKSSSIAGVNCDLVLICQPDASWEVSGLLSLHVWGGAFSAPGISKA